MSVLTRKPNEYVTVAATSARYFRLSLLTRFGNPLTHTLIYYSLLLYPLPDSSPVVVAVFYLTDYTCRSGGSPYQTFLSITLLST
jgi:hypothetical protein